jgi:hypothetical protein
VVDDPRVTGVAAALVGDLRVSEVDAWVARALLQLTGADLAEVLFRSGRIDAVFGVLTTDGRRLVVKVHRPPVDLAVRRATARAQRTLADAGFPCASPIVDGERIDGRVVSIETAVESGTPGDAHNPAVRRAIAHGLAEQIHILRTPPDLAAAGRDAPAWCRYDVGPWPTPHDSFFDFRNTPGGWSWLDDLAASASAAALHARENDDSLAVAHADWYCGNLRFDGSQLVACFDWDLVADSVAAVAGLTAGFFSHGTSEGAEQVEPADVVEFLVDFERAAGTRFHAEQQRGAAACATWSVCYAARCQLQMLDGDPAPGSPLAALQQHGTDYLAMRW